jgi:membrane fusion protein (multidrug efflux system)
VPEANEVRRSEAREERAPIELRPKQKPEDASLAPEAPAREPPSRRDRIRRLMFALLPIALLGVGYFYVTGGAIMSTDNAYVQADHVAISTDISGIVKKVTVKESQKVAAGDELFELDDQPFRIALQRADAQLGETRNALEAMKANYRDLQEQIKQAQADVEYYQRDFDRQQQLVARQATPQATVDQSRRNLIDAQQKVASLQQQLAGVVANLNGDPDINVEKHPRYLDAQAQRDEAQRQLSHAIVRAPFAGIVTNVSSLQPGQYLPASTASISLVATDHVWVDAQPKETELTYVKPGQPVTVSVDTYPDVTWKGTVESISPASGATFALLPAQNTSGNWVKVVQRIPMRVRLETPSDKPPLRVGMSAVIDVNTGHARGLPTFVKRLFGGEAQAHDYDTQR